MTVLHGIWHGLDQALFMVWDTLWALVLGFTLSGAVQAFVRRGEMRAALGDHRPRTLARSSFFGAISSSCSYASSALAKSLFARGADFTAALVFMIAATNLVLELGIVLWLLIGWQFALAEFVGGAIMIVLLALLVPRVVPRSWIDDARDAAADRRGDGGRCSRRRRERAAAPAAAQHARLAGRRRLHRQRPDHAAQGAAASASWSRATSPRWCRQRSGSRSSSPVTGSGRRWRTSYSARSWR